MDDGNVGHTALFTELANCLHKWLRLDISDSAAKLGNDHVGIGNLFNTCKTGFNGIGHMRNDLYRTAQKIPGAFALNKRLINQARSEIRLTREVLVNKALVMAKIQIGFFAVLRYKYFSMLKRTHGTRVNIEIRIGFLHHDLISTSL